MESTESPSQQSSSISMIWNIAYLAITVLMVIISCLICAACYNLFRSSTRRNDVTEQTSWSTVLRNHNRLVRKKRHNPASQAGNN